MIKATVKDTEKLLDYLKKDMSNCLYICIDISVYGLADEYLSVWYDEDDNGLSLVIMKYHNAFQIYTDREEWDVEGLLKLVEEYDINAIHGTKDMIKAIESSVEDRYKVMYGSVFTFAPPRKNLLEHKYEFGEATAEETTEIAELMCSDKHWASQYTVEEMAKQLRDRIETKTGRSFVMRDNGRIIAHDATFAETEYLAILSGMIVDKEYRDDPLLGVTIGDCVNRTLRAEGKEIYFKVSNPVRARLFERLGHLKIGEYGKCVKKKG